MTRHLFLVFTGMVLSIIIFSSPVFAGGQLCDCDIFSEEFAEPGRMEVATTVYEQVHFAAEAYKTFSELQPETSKYFQRLSIQEEDKLSLLNDFFESNSTPVPIGLGRHGPDLADYTKRAKQSPQEAVTSALEIESKTLELVTLQMNSTKDYFLGNTLETLVFDAQQHLCGLSAFAQEKGYPLDPKWQNIGLSQYFCYDKEAYSLFSP